jgi:hypothetical protein
MVAKMLKVTIVGLPTLYESLEEKRLLLFIQVGSFFVYIFPNAIEQIARIPKKEEAKT